MPNNGKFDINNSYYNIAFYDAFIVYLLSILLFICDNSYSYITYKIVL